mmetsp:Transcript_17747/g.49189  ORF Transcript_17747/g.49189 Transcript_17747/m.49189 type:complete len:250 (-) Transcript_17747:363-1112(-)
MPMDGVPVDHQRRHGLHGRRRLAQRDGNTSAATAALPRLRALGGQACAVQTSRSGVNVCLAVATAARRGRDPHAQVGLQSHELTKADGATMILVQHFHQARRVGPVTHARASVRELADRDLAVVVDVNATESSLEGAVPVGQKLEQSVQGLDCLVIDCALGGGRALALGGRLLLGFLAEAAEEPCKVFLLKQVCLLLRLLGLKFLPQLPQLQGCRGLQFDIVCSIPLPPHRVVLDLEVCLIDVILRIVA